MRPEKIEKQQARDPIKPRPRLRSSQALIRLSLQPAFPPIALIYRRSYFQYAALEHYQSKGKLRRRSGTYTQLSSDSDRSSFGMTIPVPWSISVISLVRITHAPQNLCPATTITSREERSSSKDCTARNCDPSRAAEA